ncbi:MAG: M14 family metallopeptidase [Lachnospiraceae bacterium]
MIESIVNVELPVNEVLSIKKKRLIPHYSENKQNLKRISIVTCIHGDELEGQYVCFELQKRVKENIHFLTGIIDVYPAINPLGIDSITRGIPGVDLDLNRMFPGDGEYSMAEYLAARVADDLKGSDVCIDIHASNIFLREIPQVRINVETAKADLHYAKLLNTDIIWMHHPSTVLQSTLSHTLNKAGTPTLVVEMGVGMRITREYCHQLTDGIFVLMKELGIWSGEVISPRESIIATDKGVDFINASASGLFIPLKQHGEHVLKKEQIGDIVDPFNGMVLDHITSPCAGTIFTLREYPVVYSGSLIARILRDDNGRGAA